MQGKLIGGAKYFLMLKDDYFHYRCVHFLENKEKTKKCIENFLIKNSKHCPKGVQFLRTDNGLEFVNIKIKEMKHQHGFTHQRTVAYTPEQNGIAEQENRTVVEAARTIMQEKINTVVHVLNRTGTSSERASQLFGFPFKLWTKRKPDLHDLRVFGEKVYTHIPKEKRRKWDSKAKRGYLIGYGDGVKGYKIWYPDKGCLRRLVGFIIRLNNGTQWTIS